MKPIETLRQRAKDSGFKLTPQRILIFSILSGCRDHPSAEILYRKVRKVQPTISMNTIYQTLDVLQSLSLVNQINPDDVSARFEANTHPHHHLVCTRCRKIEDIDDHSLTRLAAPERFKKGYKISHYRVIFYGRCISCQK